MTCPTCGAVNDPGNRFCDQCGTRLEPSTAEPQASVQTAQAAPATLTCPRCGSPALPGEAFCDECGASLSELTATPVSSDAPTVVATPVPVAGSASPGSGPVCPQCGHENLPGNQFCDNCGANLLAAPTNGAEQQPAPAHGDEGDVAVTEAPAQEPEAAPAAPVAEEAPAETAAAPEAAVEAPADTSAAPAEAPAPAAEESAAPTDAQAAYEAQRKQLEEEIARQQLVISQLEAVQQSLGAATPAGVLQSLDETRAAVARLQAELDALQPPPAVDPAEIARLNDEIARQQQVIGQLEAVQQSLGAATPAGVLQSLDEARAAVARLQAELDALPGGAGAAPAPEAAQPPAADASAPTVAAPATDVVDAPEPPAEAAAPATTDASSPTDQTIVAAPAEQPAPATASAGARLIIEESGQEVLLPTDRSEIVIGREDPISGIHPEVDMTPHGGESGGVSRQHARLALVDGQWTITDLNSTNYTRVDGVKLDPNVPMPLKDGARIQLGRVAVTFRL